MRCLLISTVVQVRVLSVFIFCLTPLTALAASAASTPQLVSVSVDQDLLTLIKIAVWAGGAFLAVYALIGLTFFGWDVRKARTSLLDAQKETNELLQELKTDLNKMKELKEKLEQLGAELEASSSTGTNEVPLKDASTRTSIDLIREVIESSNFEWTTIERIVNRTGFTREQVLEEIRKASDVRIGKGKKSQDFIFKLKDND